MDQVIAAHERRVREGYRLRHFAILRLWRGLRRWVGA